MAFYWLLKSVLTTTKGSKAYSVVWEFLWWRILCIFGWRLSMLIQHMEINEVC